ncbi:MAG: hypothetical protein H0X42_11235 [Solirubrobacterales bacterium]|nr:hypothetical protein [Solirubrobacterales bacterium]
MAGAAVVLAVLVYGDHVRHGGWVGDAWLTRAWYVLYPHDSFTGTVGHFLDLKSMSPRPANAVYRVLLNEWLSGDMGAWYAWQLITGVGMCVALYVLLRELGVRFWDAAAVSVLLVVFPASASLWLWSPVAHASLAITLGLVGFLLAMRGFRANGRRARALHAASLLAFLLSVLLYEICLPLFLASFLLYALRVPRRRALARWAADCAVLLPVAILVTRSTEARDQGLGGSISHAGEIVGDLPRLALQNLLPFGSFIILAAALLAAFYLAAAAVARRCPPGDPLGQRLRFFFALTSAGLLVVALGYLIYVPGLLYYHPLSPGIGDRVNAVAGIGWVFILYALLAMLATLIARAVRRPPLFAGLATAALAATLGVSWLAPIAEESRGYVSAYLQGERVRSVVTRAIPDPTDHPAIWTFGQPVEASPGIPIFANYWNMTAAMALAYHDHGVRSFVALPGTSFDCRSDGMVPGGSPEYPEPGPGRLGRFGSRYGHTYFVDTVHGQFATVANRKQCLSLRDAFQRAPRLSLSDSG